jgi:hypothetical protein
MLFTPQHYGKKIDNFTENEKKLFVLDGILTMTIERMKEGDESEGLKIMSGLLGKKRVQIICEIMGYQFVSGDRELVDRVENTKYGYLKFLQDMTTNQEQIFEQDRISQMN